MPPMPSSEFETLRTTAARLIQDLLLPGSIPTMMWGGYGSGKPCSLCNEPIDAQQVEYELGGIESNAVTPFRFHIWCHAAWQLEVAK